MPKTNSTYDISYICEVDSQGYVVLMYRFFEGSYQDVTQPDGTTLNQFVRETLIHEGTIYFDYFIVPEIDYHISIKEVLKEYSNLPLIPEQA